MRKLEIIVFFVFQKYILVKSVGCFRPRKHLRSTCDGTDYYRSLPHFSLVVSYFLLLSSVSEQPITPVSVLNLIWSTYCQIVAILYLSPIGQHIKDSATLLYIAIRVRAKDLINSYKQLNIVLYIVFQVGHILRLIT